MRILVVGATVRALAESAHACGHEVIACDLFGDEDLRAVARSVETIAWEDYPRGFVSFAQRHPSLPRVYTGGLENYPEVLEALALIGPLWGNKGEPLQTVRDPFRLAEWMARFPGAHPEVARKIPWEASAREWLVKSTTGSGGIHVRSALSGQAQNHEFYQRHVAGRSASAVFCGTSREAILLGTTRQFLVRDVAQNDSAKLEAFQYAGSAGPLEPDHARDRMLERWGEALVRELGIRGVFGIDFIETEHGPVLIEVNPRYPASAEVLERAGHFSVFEFHRSAFDAAARLPHRPDYAGRKAGKWIVYAPVAGHFRRNEENASNNSLGPAAMKLADIPADGTPFEAGAPVFTLIGDCPADSAMEWPGLAVAWWLRRCFVPKDRAPATD